ncbi:MAG: serpin family protein [Desulfobacteraceae bacterium]|jgi:serpin B
MKRRLLTGVLIFLYFTLSMGIAVGAEDNATQFYSAQSKFSQWLTKRFVINSPTFQFDGIRETLELTDTITLRCSNCWEFHYEFDCANAGYGDRTDEMVASVITHHKARITVNQFKVTQAILDDQWDMINQTMLTEDSMVDPEDPVESEDDPPSEAEIVTQVQGNNSFAFELYHELGAQDGNIFYSPYSISVALAMAYAGARNDTETQIADTLHFELSQAKLHPAFKNLSDELASRNYEEATVEDGRGFKLNIANAAWGQEGYTFLDEYLDTLDLNYGGGFNPVDFMADPEAARIIINNWVSEQTEDRIPDLIAEGVLNTMTRLVLTNAVYFNAAWGYPFVDDRTYQEQFFLLDGQTSTVDMMHQTTEFGYSEGENYQAVSLPYQNEELSMVILLPQEGQFDLFESSLSSEKIEMIMQEMSSCEVNLSLPKFTFESDFTLKTPLQNMGMIDGFSENADFSGITGERSLFISDVIHKGFVAVDEEGTEAAAATAVVFDNYSMVQNEDFIADRPFIFLICDHATETILFIGRVMSPNET